MIIYAKYDSVKSRSSWWHHVNEEYSLPSHHKIYQIKYKSGKTSFKYQQLCEAKVWETVANGHNQSDISSQLECLHMTWTHIWLALAKQVLVGNTILYQAWMWWIRQRWSVFSGIKILFQISNFKSSLHGTVTLITQILPLPLGIWPAEDRGSAMWRHTGGRGWRRSFPCTPGHDGLLFRLFQSHVHRWVYKASHWSEHLPNSVLAFFYWNHLTLMYLSYFLMV